MSETGDNDYERMDVDYDNFPDLGREFDLVDEANEDGAPADVGNNDDSEFEISDDELEKLLEEDLPEEFRKGRKKGEEDGTGDSFLLKKFSADEKCPHHATPLPRGWIFTMHNSGVKVYLHKDSRICTLARPYYLGPASVRRHNIPLSAIPCLQFRAAREEEATQCNKYQIRVDAPVVDPEEAALGMQNGIDSHQPIAELSNKEMPNPPDGRSQTAEQTKTLARIMNHAGGVYNGPPDITKLNIPTAIDSDTTYAVTSDQLREYCTDLMGIRKIEIRRYKSWKERRAHSRKEKKIQLLDVPNAPGAKRVLKFKVQPDAKLSASTGKQTKPTKEWILNPNGKSYVCILHEYMQHVMKKMPKYVYTELENASTPYGCSVTIDDVKYGMAQGPSKKIAKLEAAKKALEILIPQIREFIKETEGPLAPKLLHEDLSFFDDVSIEDPRIAQLCIKVSEPTPYSILLTCIQRNFGLVESNIEFKMHPVKLQKNEAEMIVGKHSVRVPCKSKKDGKQLASQAILQVMHPHIKTWGSMLRLYGNQSLQPLVEKRALEKGITVLQGKATVNEPNYAILEKLKFEMDKLCQRKEAFRPIGKFTVPTDVEMPSCSSSHLKNVET